MTDEELCIAWLTRRIERLSDAPVAEENRAIAEGGTPFVIINNGYEKPEADGGITKFDPFRMVDCAVSVAERLRSAVNGTARLTWRVRPQFTYGNLYLRLVFEPYAFKHPVF